MRYQFAVLIWLSLWATACTMPVEGSFYDEDRSDNLDSLQTIEKYVDNPLSFPVPSRPFEFCSESGASIRSVELPDLPEVNLGNAEWLAFLSANQYAHYAHLAPMLEEMGFGYPGEGKWWEDQARHIATLKRLEEAGDEVPGTTARYKQELLQTVRPGTGIQFFSGGWIVDNEFVSDSTQVGWARHSTLPLVLIVFRGTDTEAGTNFSDLRINVDAGFSELSSWGSVHTGFLEGWLQVRDLIRTKMEIDGADTNVWLSGHSLGGALATLATASLVDAASEMEAPPYTIAGLYTFGQPRVGDKQFAQALKSAALGYTPGPDGLRGTYDDQLEVWPFSVVRVRNGDDIVTQSPPQLGGYRHAGPVLHLPAGTTDIGFDGLIELDGTESDEGFLDDHKMDGYYTRLKAAIEDSNQPPSFCPS